MRGGQAVAFGTSPPAARCVQVTREQRSIMEHPAEEVHVTTEEARGGKTRMGVRYVLAITLVLAIVVLSALWLVGARGPDRSGQAPETAATPAPISS